MRWAEARRPDLLAAAESAAVAIGDSAATAAVYGDRLYVLAHGGGSPPSALCSGALGGANALRCSGRGRCVAGECMCDHGYAGLSCDRLVADLEASERGAGRRLGVGCAAARARSSRGVGSSLYLLLSLVGGHTWRVARISTHA